MFGLDQLQMGHVINIRKFVVNEFELLLIQTKKILDK